MGNRVYVIGGRGDAPDTPTDRILSVDVAEGRIASAGRLPEPLSDAAATAVGQHILVAGVRPGGRHRQASCSSPRPADGSVAAIGCKRGEGRTPNHRFG